MKRIAALFVLAAAALPAMAASTVVYKGGNDIVVKTADGKLMNYTVKDGAAIAALKPGATVTAPIAGDSVAVTKVAVVKAKVYAVTLPDTVTLMTAEGAKDFTVPTGTTFTVDGKAVKFADLKPETMIEATLVTPAGEGDDTSVAPATPAPSGVLLVAKPSDLPLAGTHLPLYGIFGATLLLAGFALLRFRRVGLQS